MNASLLPSSSVFVTVHAAGNRNNFPGGVLSPKRNEQAAIRV
jgi:hypothetical protein